MSTIVMNQVKFVFICILGIIANRCCKNKLYGQKSLILAIFRQSGKLFLNELRIIQHPLKLADNLLTIIALRGLSDE